ncbi:Csu type fimbrial protein [Acinetobacter baumannii]|uniref:Csu type fimbrial protein n=1 Tax=Acinetobacter baumannii TaxID=470 RepID=UPI000D689781|nr:spore coat U domain-containing protein [Acinetobacter baumannii]
MKLYKYFFPVTVLIAVPAYTMSAVQSSQFHVKMQITETCDIGTGTTSDINFGTVTRNTNNVQATGSLKVYCTNGTPYTIALENNGSLKNNTDDSIQVPYQLYRDAAMTKEWGNVADNSYSQQGVGQVQNITIWGKVSNTNVPAGQYSDKVTAIITY